MSDVILIRNAAQHTHTAARQRPAVGRHFAARSRKIRRMTTRCRRIFCIRPVASVGILLSILLLSIQQTTERDLNEAGRIQICIIAIGVINNFDESTYAKVDFKNTRSEKFCEQEYLYFMPFNMLSSKMNVNKKLLPIKGHFFFFNAGTAPLVPYLSSYARQLGFSASTVGIIYTVLPLFGLIAKPLFGVIADRFKIQKSIFILFQIITIVSFFLIYFIPSNGSALSVELDCNKVTMLRSCFDSSNQVDTCAVDALGNMNTSASCKMNCDMTSPKMWQTVCEHWHIPQYCYSVTNTLEYTAHISRLQMKQECAYLSASNVTLDGYLYTPGCRIGQGFVDVNEPCHLNCSNTKLSAVFANQLANMTCLDKTLNFRVCNDSRLEALSREPWPGGECQVSCALEKGAPWRLMEICEGWHADMASTCRPRTQNDAHFPSNLSFVGSVPLSTTIAEHNCVYTQLKHITLPDGTTHNPMCESRAQYQMETDLFQTSCEINCDNALLNEMIQSASETQQRSSEYTTEFWLFFLMMIISWVGQAVVVTFADAICFNLLGDKASLYGRQRLWGSVGWGIFSLLTGSLIDLFSDGAYKDYMVAFALMFALMSVDVIVSLLLKIDATKMSVNILADVGTLLSSLPTFLFFAWTVAVGLCTGLLWNFLFWLVEDVTKAQQDCGSDYSKTLQGLISAIQTFFGEIPFLFLSGYILKKIGHVSMMSIVLFAFGVRFILYSFLSNPWWVLPIEMLQGVTFGMFYPTMTSYANIVAPPGTETTVQGLVGAVFEGVGTSLGSFIGGRLYTAYGGVLTFRWFGYGALVCCALNALAQYLIRDKTANISQGYTAVIRYEQPSDMVYMLEDVYEGKL